MISRLLFCLVGALSACVVPAVVGDRNRPETGSSDVLDAQQDVPLDNGIDVPSVDDIVAQLDTVEVTLPNDATDDRPDVCVPAVEICNGVDDDCDSLVDEGLTCTPTCPSGQTPCLGACVDLTSNASHCGACGTPCPAGQRCVLGRCTI